MGIKIFLKGKNLTNLIKNYLILTWVGELAQQLRALVALAEGYG